MIIKKTCQDKIRHQRTKTVHSKIDKGTERKIKNRKDQVTLAQIRSGKHLPFQAFRITNHKWTMKHQRCAQDAEKNNTQWNTGFYTAQPH